MFGFIKKLITGILNFFVGLFGGKKGGYYLQLDEAAEATQDAAKQAASNVKKAAGSVVSNVKEAAESVASNAKKAAESVTSNAQEATEPVASNAKKAVESVASNAKKVAEPVASNAKKAAQPVAAATTTNNGNKSAAASGEPQPAKVELVQTAEGLKAEPKAKSSKAAKVTQQQPTETTFAPKYLVPTNSNGRRRPGANMSSFLDMARQVKTPG